MILVASNQTVAAINETAERLTQLKVGQHLSSALNKLEWSNDKIEQILFIFNNKKDLDIGLDIEPFNNNDISWSFYAFKNNFLIVGDNASQLKEEIMILTKIIQKAPALIYWKDLNSNHLGCNETFARYAKLENPEQVIGLSDYDLPWRAEAESFQKDDKEVMDSGQSKLNIENRLPLGNGREATVITNKMPLKDNNKIIGVLDTATDITEFKKVQVQLKKALEQAKIAEKTKETVVHNLRHDWITPFCGIHSINEMMFRDEKDPSRKEMLKMASESATVLMAHTKSILKMIEAAEGLPLICEKLINPWKICRDVHKMFLPEAVRKSIQFKLKLGGNEVEVLGDYFRLERILINLVSNALKFIDIDSANPYIIMALQVINKNDDCIQLNFLVKDNGIGMTYNQINEIYEPLYRAYPAYEAIYQGAGTGLTIVKQYVSDIGGEIACQSEFGQGSTFAVAIKFRRSMFLPNTFDIVNE